MQALHFTRHDMTEQGSASSLFAAKGAPRTGIYVPEFANDERYVGQTVDIVARYASHRRHHGDIAALNFAPCAPELLDEAERTTVHEQEQHHRLRNIMLTDLPGGDDDLTLTFDDEISATLPWQRERRATVADEANSRRQRSWQLQAHPEWHQLVAVLARYVDETVPAPISTSGQLWTLTALPGTGRRSDDHRLITLNCGQMETLYIREVTIEGEPIVAASFNLLTTQEGFDAIAERLDAANAPWEAFIGNYRAEPDAVSILVENWGSILQALEIPELLDGCYDLNVRLMRRGVSMFRRSHNTTLAGHVFDRIGAGAS
ncbi:GIY-YIG nuclease family protein [Pseudoclavibacter soli]|uniref:GIY-YIG nuclease family protein n=1 Tax=Pseudoclavibacter soli TaxID=452623 RepID=UPI00040481FE|nr:GIY-YIG nuclease family protein [Pseudoclavibacter soli]